MSLSVEAAPMLPINAFSVVTAFMVSAFDYVASALLLEREWLSRTSGLSTETSRLQSAESSIKC